MSAVPETPRSPGSVASLRARYRDGKAALVEHFRAARPSATVASQLLKTLARHVDATLSDLWDHAGMPPTGLKREGPAWTRRIPNSPPPFASS